MAIDQRAHVRIACGAFAAALLCSVSTVALAGPRHAPRAPAVTQAQVDQIMSELQNERAAREAAEARLQALTDRLAALEQTTQTVAANQETQTTAVADLSSTVTTLNLAPRATVNNARMTVATQDNKFSASMRGIFMLDTAGYYQDSPGPIATDLRRGGGSGDTARARNLNSGTNFRRARFGIEGRAFTDFTYSMIYEFGGSGAEDAGHIYELYAQYNGIPNWQFRVGAFEPQVGLAANVSTTGMMLLERPSGAEITRNIAAGDSRSALQVEHWGDIGGDTGLSALYMVAASVTGSSVSTVNSTAASPPSRSASSAASTAASPWPRSPAPTGWRTWGSTAPTSSTSQTTSARTPTG
jgi:phosphate-selective porin OprO/OprP